MSEVSSGGRHDEASADSLSGARATRDGIIQTSVRLFSHLGYDATSVQMIADSAGVSVATVTQAVGDKRELYLTVVEELHEVERVYLEAAVAEFTPDLAGLHLLADSYLDFRLAHPEQAAMWMHRWLWDAEEFQQLDEQYTRPLVSMMIEAARSAVRNDELDIEMAVWNVIWCTQGFIPTGVLGVAGQPQRSADPGAVSRFRAYLHQFIDRMA